MGKLLKVSYEQIGTALVSFAVLLSGRLGQKFKFSDVLQHENKY